MAPKRPRHNTGAADTPTDIPAPDTPDAALTVVRRLVKQFSLDVQIEDDDSEHGVGVGFSKVTYDDVAPLVGLEPWNALKDIGTFEIHRSRIPTDLFKSIVMDIDILLMQHGPPHEHKTEEARSRFFSPIFNHLVKEFTFTLRNDPETTATQGRIEYYFKAFGAVAVLFIEIQPKVFNDEERLKAIAQVIAKGDGCDASNLSHDFSLPIHCIFFDGWSFEFFKYERTPNRTFLRGCFHGDPKHLRRGLEMHDFVRMETPLPWILQFRCICETIFDVMLSAYIAGLKAYNNRLPGKGEKRGLKSLGKWDQALQSAEDALAVFREAEGLREGGDLDGADTTVDRALLALQESTSAVPTMYKSGLIMTAWDDAEVRKA
ncbi:uncharacterized protein EI90DRAFT_3123141 [Cantharellus anzutake]|uniref:uncharacterized protein n=1 Tax=Cantharellus anzutake TaxID=1750568 RepID=UPI001908DD3A|nr:uncharacterized protein EI90DRAFT_3123141 [Cantharellus anzutake]KAF8332067.1 hypothetical protein EI90DRAFT_3123141 [Cantharellus anzutake]